MSLGPKPYPVVYDPTNGLQYVFETGAVGIDVDNNAITALTGAVTAAGPGSVAASLTSTSVTAALLTNFVSGAGTVSTADTILQAFNKINGNVAATVTVANAALPRAGGAMTGALTFTGTTFAVTPPILTDTQMNALTPTEGMTIYNSISHALAFYNGSAWKVVATV